MKIIFIALLFLTLSCQAESVTIKKHELAGNWQTHFGYGVKPKPDARVDYLNITKEFNVSYEMNISDTNKRVIKAKNTQFHNNDELYIITFNTEKEITFKLAFSGWVNGNQKLLFGMLYLYNNGQLFNGIPVSFKPGN